MRLTNENKTLECRGNCEMEDYLIMLFNKDYYKLSKMIDGKCICDNCPFEKVYNKLAEYEDLYS